MTEVPLGELRDYEIRQLLKGEVVPVVFPPRSESNNTPFNVQKNLSWIEGMHVLQEERFVSGLGYNLGFMLTYYFAGVTPSYTISSATKTPFTHEFYTEIESYGLNQPDQSIYDLFLRLSKTTNGLP
jgi:hypothetical protein